MEQVTNAMLPEWVQWILLLFASVGVIGAGFSYIGKLVQKATKPITDLTVKLDNLAKRGETRDCRVDDLEDAIKQSKEYNKEICRLVLAIANHEIDGNSVDALKKQRDKMNEFLTDK